MAFNKLWEQLIFLCVCLYETGCSVEEALEAASLHPAQLLGISHRKGTLDYGADAGQSRPPGVKPLCRVWLCLTRAALLQTWCCSTATSTFEPPTSLGRRFGETERRRRGGGGAGAGASPGPPVPSESAANNNRSTTLRKCVNTRRR